MHLFARCEQQPVYEVSCNLILVERFRKLDEQYASIGDNGKSGIMATEERILSYQRMLDERSRTEYNLEVRFKTRFFTPQIHGSFFLIYMYILCVTLFSRLQDLKNKN